MGLFSKLFDPNAGEIKRLQKIVNKIDSFEEAHKKLSSGKGNLLSRVEGIKELGIKTSKQLSVSEE